MEYLSDALTLQRIVLCASLLFLRPFSVWFFVLYTTCGIGDILDEYLAQGPGCTGPADARPDSTAGFTSAAVLLFRLVPTMDLPVWPFWWIAGTTLIEFSSLVAGYVRYEQVTFLHTYANRATGLLLFCLSYGLPLWGLLAGTAVCLSATPTTVEKLALCLVSPVLNQDVKRLSFR